MPALAMPPARLGFVTTGPFDPTDPAAGHERALRLIDLGEQLGLDTAWLRPDHLQHGISSPVAVLAAASQRTRRIGLGTASIPIAAENPFRLAEDLATVDLLCAGRLQPGLSVGNPSRAAAYARVMHPTTAEHEEPGRERLLRFRDLVRGEMVRDPVGDGGAKHIASRVQPHAPGLADRLWYGAATLRTATWAGQNGFRLLASGVTERRAGDDFDRNQRTLIDAYRAGHPQPAEARVALALVVIPTDGATREQRSRYAADAAARVVRTEDPRGSSSMVYASDLIGPSDELAARLLADPAVQAADELAVALPAGLDEDDHVQILTDVAERLGPALGWIPSR